MHWRRRREREALGALALVLIVACGGQSKDGRGGVGSTAGVAGSAGSVDPGSCIYNGIRYVSGERFGSCQQCSCADGGVSCDLTDCMPTPVGGSSNGGSNNGGSNSGGSSSGGSSAGAGQGGSSSSVAGAGNACELASIGSLCVLGGPDGQLLAGAPLLVYLQPAGCYSSSCTKLVSHSCNYLGSGGTYWISGFICLAREGEVCTDDCGGAQPVTCAPGLTLEAGAYTVGLGGTSLSVSFTVPGPVPNGGLCVSM